MGEDGVEVGFEERMSWLPTHVFDEACDSKEYLRNQRHPQHGHLLNSTAEPLLTQPKSSLKPHHRRRVQPTNWPAGGPGMQFIFLDYGQRSCGTGVYLPRKAGTDLQSREKPDTNNDPESVDDRKAMTQKKGKDAVVSQSRSSTSGEIFLPKEWTY